MSDIKTTRPFQQRFLDGFERSQLREEVQKVPSRKFKSLRKKYATLALGASLAVGGLGVPMKMIHDVRSGASKATDSSKPAVALAASGIGSDLAQAATIAKEVAGGVSGGVQALAGGVTAAGEPLKSVVSVPQKTLTALTDGIKEQFFSREVPFGSLIYSEARKNDLPPELVAAVVHTESKFNPNARSQAGAVGLMQLVPRTGRWMGAQDLSNPVQNITAGAKYLKYLTDRFDGDQQKAIAAYNAGEGNVRRFNGVPPFRETLKYVERVRSFQADLGQRLAGQTADTQVASAE